MYGLIDPNLLLNSIYESAIDFGIVTLDRNRTVTSWNKTAPAPTLPADVV